MTQAGPFPWSAGFANLSVERNLRLAQIDGTVPPALRGTLYRNGSGRNRIAGSWFPHWFDGDGLVQSFTFDDRGIFHRRLFVRTRNYLDETLTQRSLHRGFGKMRPGRGMLGVLANFLQQPANVSNTSVVMQGGRLFSLWEGGPPYELDPETIDTRGVETFGGMVKAFSAHPKIDPETGELFNFGIDYGPRTTLTPYRMKDGTVTKLPAVTLPYPLMNHDFVLTERHLVFCLGPILVRALPMILGLTSFDGSLHWDGGKPTQLLLVRRDGQGAPRWIELEPFFQFHFANGFERDNILTIDLARYPDYCTVGEALRTYWRSQWPAEGMAKMVRLTVDLSTGRATTRDYRSGTANEFPRINPRSVGRPYRYAWIACNPTDRTEGLQQQIARIDVESGAVVIHDFGPDCYLGEPVFVPTQGASAEEDGVVLVTLFDARRKVSRLVGLDGRDPGARPLFSATLDAAIPYALHGFFQPAGS